MEDQKLGISAAVALLIGSVVGAGAMVALTDTGPTDIETPFDSEKDNTTGVSTFDGETDFHSYLRRGQSSDSADGQEFNMPTPDEDIADRDIMIDAPMEESEGDFAGDIADGSGDEGTQPRHSSTNVQEIGIDEPDLLKNTGDHVYYSSKSQYRIYRDVRAPPRKRISGKTHVIDSGEPANPNVIAGINDSGNLLLSNDSLVVFQNDRLVGYDVTDPQNPEQSWSRSINGSIETARLNDGKIYLVTRSPVSPSMACPVEPLSGPGGSIECSDIYRPNRQIPADVTYTAYSLEPTDGEVTDTVSAVGTSERSAIYMSENALYLTYTERTSRGDILIDAALSNETDVPEWVETRLREIRSYDLSDRATEIEVQATLQQYFNSAKEDGAPRDDILGVDFPGQQYINNNEERNARNQFYDNLDLYVQNNSRQFVKTGIVRFGVGEGLSVEASGKVPGQPLNQFSMDEHDGTLRIATTIPRQFGTDSVNDLYTLDASTLDRSGAVKGMGVDERVYAVRYIGDTGYVVTFRQIDPFHVVDISDPANPEEVGELELPGYSSYLHPIDENHVLGIGEENGKVKTVMFNVSKPGNPTIEDTHYPNSYWSAISESHHAFLLDRRHEVFFLPGDNSGHVIGYSDGQLTPKDEIATNGQPRRAAYIDDFLYVFSDQELVVENETNWSRETAVQLPGN